MIKISRCILYAASTRDHSITALSGAYFACMSLQGHFSDSKLSDQTLCYSEMHRKRKIHLFGVIAFDILVALNDSVEILPEDGIAQSRQ